MNKQPIENEIDALLNAGSKVVTEEYPNTETQVMERNKRDKKYCLYYDPKRMRCVSGHCKKGRKVSDGSCKTAGKTEHYTWWGEEEKEGMKFMHADKL